MANKLETRFIFDDSTGSAKVDSLNKKLVETNASINNLKTDKAAQAFTTLANVGQDSLNRLKNAANEIDRVFAGPQLAFADKYKSAFSDIESRSQKLAGSFQKLAQTKADKGQFDVISQGAIGAEQKVIALTRKVREIKKDASDPANAKFGKFYSDGIREAERELDKYQRKLTNLNRQQRSLGSGNFGGGGTGGGFGSGFSGGFGRRAFGSNLFNAFNVDDVGSNAFGGALLGGAAGALVVSGLSAAKNAAFALTAEVKDLTIESVKLAANFEESTNSLAIFAGGTYNARSELSKLDAVALKTPGLTLENAETGYKRLRALNFEAGISRDLIRGLGIARQQNGADAASVDRVITNLTQLTSGSGTAADVRQTIQALPSLRGTFQRAFGTADFGEINKLAKSNPDEFIRKFTDELSKAKTAQVGLNIAIEQGTNSLTLAGRTFGEPFLQPLTRDVLGLTKTLNENENTVKKWGQNFADVYNGLSTLITENPGVLKFLSFQARNTIAVSTFGLSEAVIGITGGIQKIGENRRREEEKLNRPGAEGALSFNFQQQQEENENAEKALKKRQELIELQKRIDAAEIENNLNYSKAVAASRFGGVKLLQENTNLEINALRQQIAANNNSAISSSANLSEEDFKAGKGLQIVKQRDLENAKLQNQIAVLQITSQKQIADEIRNTADRVKELGKAYSGVLDNLILQSNADNPFVRVFSEAKSELDKLKESIKGLPEDMQRAAIASQQTISRNKLFEARIDNSLSVLNLKEIADKFRNSNRAENDKRFFDEAVQNDVRRGNFFPDPGGTYGSFTANQAGGFDKLTDAQKRDIYNVAQLKLLQNPNANFNSLLDSNVNDRSLISRLAREQVNASSGENLSAQERLQKQLGVINSGVSSDDERAIADRKLLALVANLDPSQINQNQREQIAAAADRKAERDSNFEKQAYELEQRKLSSQERLITVMEKFTKIAEEKGFDELKIILDDKTGRATATGSAGIDADVRNNYGQ